MKKYDDNFVTELWNNFWSSDLTLMRKEIVHCTDEQLKSLLFQTRTAREEYERTYDFMFEKNPISFWTQPIRKVRDELIKGQEHCHWAHCAVEVEQQRRQELLELAFENYLAS